MEAIESELKEIKDILKEFASGLVRLEQNLERLERDIEETRRQQAEDRKRWEEYVKEIERKREEDRKFLEEYIKEAERKKEEDRKFLDNYIKEAEEHRKRDKKEYNKKIGDIARKMGTLVEDIIFPATEPVLKKYFQCPISRMSHNVKAGKGGNLEEFDVVAVSHECKTVFLIEAKSKLKDKDIEEFKEKMERFKMIFDEYKDFKLIQILASLRIDKSIINQLTKQGIYAMAYREWEYMDLLNFKEIAKRQSK